MMSAVQAIHYKLVADVSSDDVEAIEPIIKSRFDGCFSSTPDGFHVEATVIGASAKDLNRELLSALRRAHRRTRLRAQWTGDGVTQRFFDYVEKGRPNVSPDP